MELRNGMEPFPKFILRWALTVYPLATVVGVAVRRRCCTQGEAAREKAVKLHQSSFPNPLQLADINRREQK